MIPRALHHGAQFVATLGVWPSYSEYGTLDLLDFKKILAKYRNNVFCKEFSLKTITPGNDTCAPIKTIRRFQWKIRNDTLSFTHEQCYQPKSVP